MLLFVSSFSVVKRSCVLWFYDYFKTCIILKIYIYIYIFWDITIIEWITNSLLRCANYHVEPLSFSPKPNNN